MTKFFTTKPFEEVCDILWNLTHETSYADDEIVDYVKTIYADFDSPQSVSCPYIYISVCKPNSTLGYNYSKTRTKISVSDLIKDAFEPTPKQKEEIEKFVDKLKKMIN